MGIILNSPGNNSRKSGVASADTEERPEVLHSNRGLRYVDREADQTHHKASENEWWTLLDTIRPDCEDDQNDGCVIRISLSDWLYNSVMQNLLAQT